MAPFPVDLRPLTESDLPLFHSWMQSDEAFGIYDEPSRQSFESLKEKWTQPDQPRNWLIFFRERPIGFCSHRFHQDNDWVSVIAVVITIPAWRGRGIGTEVHKLFSQLLFREIPSIEKIEAYTDIENLAEQRTLEKSGFEREELLRKLGILRGEVRDMYLYGLLRTSADVCGCLRPKMKKASVVDRSLLDKIDLLETD